MPSWDDVATFAQTLPRVEVSTSYRTPALKVAGKAIARLRTDAEGGLALWCSAEEKEALLAGGDPAYYTTPHYDGYGMILVDLARVDAEELRELVLEAWRHRAPVRLRAELDAP